MAVPTRTLTKADFFRKLARRLGWSQGTAASETAWTAQETYDLQDMVNSGYSRFLNTPPIPGHPGGYQWSFLKPVWSGVLETNAKRVSLPDDFGNFEGLVTVTRTTGTYFAMRLGSEDRVREAYMLSPDSSGVPALCGVEWAKGVTKIEGARAVLAVFPKADAAYTLKAAYTLIPDALSDNSPYAYGAEMHSETILLSCLAIAEERLDDIANGPQYQAFLRSLASSIQQDQRLKPADLGRNEDRSDDLNVVWNPHWQDANYTVTIGGVNPG